MAKRSASTELNKDNCDIDDPPEEPGFFQQASQETLKRRIIRTARRRCTGSSEPTEASKNVFAGFSGFSQTSQAVSKPSFSFLSAASSAATSTGSNGTDDKPKETSTATPVNGSLTDMQIKQINDKVFFSKLKGLNESVSRWISTHVTKSPLCILTPIFTDYEKHLKSLEIERKKGTLPPEETKKEEVDDSTTENEEDSAKSKDEPTSSEPKDTVKLQPPSSSPATSSLFGTKFNYSSTSIFSQAFKSPDKEGQAKSIFDTGSSPQAPSLFFGMSSKKTLPTGDFVFGASSTKPFSFEKVSKPESTEASGDNEDDGESEEPPKSDHKAVSEEGAVYEKRCKVFVKKDGQYAERGVGTLFLKPVCDGEKTQLIVRADTSLGNVILNVLLSSALPTTRVGPNNVALVCVPSPDEKPPPTTVLLRVKTSDDADELLASLEKHKK